MTAGASRRECVCGHGLDGLSERVFVRIGIAIAHVSEEERVLVFRLGAVWQVAALTRRLEAAAQINVHGDAPLDRSGLVVTLTRN